LVLQAASVSIRGDTRDIARVVFMGHPVIEGLETNGRALILDHAWFSPASSGISLEALGFV